MHGKALRRFASPTMTGLPRIRRPCSFLSAARPAGSRVVIGLPPSSSIWLRRGDLPILPRYPGADVTSRGLWRFTLYQMQDRRDEGRGPLRGGAVSSSEWAGSSLPGPPDSTSSAGLNIALTRLNLDQGVPKGQKLT